MMERRQPIPVEEAVKKVHQFQKHGQVEWVPLKNSLGRWIAEDILADHDVPAFDRSPYDGFALRAEDTKEASSEHPIEFEVIDHIGAGIVSAKTIGPFQAIRIMTGAKIPKGANVVIMLELTKTFEKDGKSMMSLKRPLKKGDNISRQGEETLKGNVMIKKGSKVTPGVTAILATFGYAVVPVVKKPVIGIISTGTELLQVSDAMVDGKIRNSNLSMVYAQVLEAGGEPLDLGGVSDDFDQSYEAVKAALSKVDMLITTGGVSVGDFDFLPAIYEKLGAEVLFNKVAMRPGSVTTVAALSNGQLLYGLSGNPAACFVGFELFVKPIIYKWCLKENPFPVFAEAKLTHDFPKANPFTRFVRASLDFAGSQLSVTPTGLDKSSAVTSIAHADCFIVLPGGTRGFSAGDQVSVLLFHHEGGAPCWMTN
ncbi:molybdopterin molybdotransferase MoeA [Bacillus altitudinis]|uniref:Molybdopterin molybdenumtransferase n=1 Tax=Bacillus altitudinis TaxID=293387 RepID=A0ABV1S1Z2_BACAB|nr:gephyrin-like molybdotransferase Glp [Bacillus altitudinis]KOA76387.1 molybdopterin molybdenumtransferase [Bacillus stratosphericus]MCL7872081.1 molybdopterin molybdotransferase MoeA [Bacillus altitudinis]MCW4359932.1 molybdopterin molybdotransferase MoeA [Bacillus altitudinis]MCY7581233.1 molybdopterin molybdotransferase MoeA [Bacillus altitudinis]MCY7597206.1 molybdopterin molybdotransferase MoeA [Bacillus altitudinis]